MRDYSKTVPASERYEVTAKEGRKIVERKRCGREDLAWEYHDEMQRKYPRAAVEFKDRYSFL